MKFSITFLVAALCLFSLTEAGINTKTPFNTVVWKGGETETILWDDDGVAPKLQDIQGFVTVDLMAGGSNNQVLVKTIGQTLATAKQIGFVVPKDIGPPGNFYFIKYTAGPYSAFSGQFSIEDVNGAIKGFDPANPNNNPNATTTTSTPASPYGTPSTESSPTPNTGDPAKSNDPYGASASSSPNANSSGSPADNPSGSTPSTTAKSLPSKISSATKLLSSLSGVASAAIALTFIYLY